MIHDLISIVAELHAQLAQANVEIATLRGNVEQLTTEIQHLRAQQEPLKGELQRLEAEVAPLRAENRQLKQQLIEARRAQHRQTSKFSKGVRKPDPKRPGRKAGDGEFTRKTEPRFDLIDTFVVAPGPVPRDCPECGREFERRVELATTTKLPVLKPIITGYFSTVCECKRCQFTIAAPHRDLRQSQQGATAHQFDDSVYAAAHVLHYGLGLPQRKVPAVLRLLCGIEISQGALSQHAVRSLVGPLATAYEGLREQVRSAKYVHTDDTGWTIAAEFAALMVFVTADITLFQIRRQHRNDEVREALGQRFRGVMSSDRGSSYDAKPLAQWRMNKCVLHLIRSVREAQAAQPESERWYGEALLKIFKMSLVLWRAYWDGEVTRCEYREFGRAVRADLDFALRRRTAPLADPQNRKLNKELGWHNARGNLLRFLDDPRIAPTNNVAERALRPAVISRKLSHCSRNEWGARAREMFMTLFCTLRSRRIDLFHGLLAIMHGADPLHLRSCSAPTAR